MVLKYILTVLTVLAAGCADRMYMSGEGQGGQAKVHDGAECVTQFQGSGHCVELTWEKAPTEGTYGIFTLKIWRPSELDKTPVLIDLPENPKVILWMPSMGHGSSPVTVEKIDVGSYRVSQVFFTMGGDWEIRIEILNADKVADAAIIPFKF